MTNCSVRDIGGGLAALVIALMSPRTGEAITWTRVTEVPASNVFSLHHHGTTLYAGSATTVYVGAAEGTSWSPTATVHPSAAAVETVLPAGGALWVGTFAQGVFRSTDDGATWGPINTGLVGLGASQIAEIVEKSGNLYVGTRGVGIFVLDLSTPTHWSDFNSGIPVSIAGTVDALVLHGTTLVAPSGPNGFVYRFPEGATEWQEGNLQPPIAPGLTPTDLISIGSDLFVGAPNHVYRSTDDGVTWTFAGTGIVANSATFLASDGAVLYAGVDFLGNNHRLYRSADSGDSWQLVDEVGGVFLFAIEVAGDKIFAARADGLWWTPLVTTPVQPTSWGGIKGRFRK